MLIFSDIWAKKNFFDSKRRYFPRNVDIFGHLDKKLFFRDLKKSSISNFEIYGDMGQKIFFQSDI